MKTPEMEARCREIIAGLASDAEAGKLDAILHAVILDGLRARLRPRAVRHAPRVRE